MSDFGKETMKEERKIRNPLIAILAARMGCEGLSVSSMAARLGISQGYMSQLLREDKLVTATNDEFIRRCAQYLQLPAVTCFLLAGRLVGSDFYELTMPFERQLEEALSSVARSREARECAVSHEQLLELPTTSQHLLVLLHEKAYGIELMKRVTADELRNTWQPHVPFTVSKVKFK